MGPDYFGEEGLLRDLAAHLCAKGVDETAVAWQIKRLTVADFAADPTPQLGLREEVRNLHGPDPLREDEDGDTELAEGTENEDDDDEN